MTVNFNIELYIAIQQSHIGLYVSAISQEGEKCFTNFILLCLFCLEKSILTETVCIATGSS